MVICCRLLGRNALHIAILKESQEMMEHFIKICPESIRIGDNVRTFNQKLQLFEFN